AIGLAGETLGGSLQPATCNLQRTTRNSKPHPRVRRAAGTGAVVQGGAHPGAVVGEVHGPRKAAAEDDLTVLRGHLPLLAVDVGAEAVAALHGHGGAEVQPAPQADARLPREALI